MVFHNISWEKKQWDARKTFSKPYQATQLGYIPENSGAQRFIGEIATANRLILICQRLDQHDGSLLQLPVHATEAFAIFHVFFHTLPRFSQQEDQ